MPVQASIGRYEILAEIGRGAMGVVYLARDPQIDRTVAIKTITLFGLNEKDEQEYLERFQREARSAGRLLHPGIVTIFDAGTDAANNKPFIVMEHVPGSSLKGLLEKQGRLELASALRLGEEVAEALQVAHSNGVIHRDIKPENILVTPEGHAKIADFGIARIDQSHVTMVAQVLGSPAYMAPEQLESGIADARSDLFSLGVVLYTALTGHRPFQGNSTATVCFKLLNRDPIPVSSWSVDFPPELDAILSRALAKDPSQRFQNGIEMAQELKRFREACERRERPLDGIAKIIDRDPMAAEQQKLDALLETESVMGMVEQVMQTGKTEKPPTPASPAKEKKPDLKPGWNISPVNTASVALSLVIAASLILVWKQHRNVGQGSAMPVTAHVASPVSDPVSEAKSESVEETAGQGTPTPPTTRAKKAKVALRNQDQKPDTARTLPPTSAALRPAVGSPKTARKADNLEVAQQPTEQVVTVNMVPLATLDVIIEHGFQDAQASVSVDGRVVSSDELHADKKRRALIFQHAEGRQTESLTLAPGKHLVAVRVTSDADHYDASQSVSQPFPPGGKLSLTLKCDKRHNKLELLPQ